MLRGPGGFKRRVFKFYPDFPIHSSHRIFGIGTQVHQYLMDLCRVRQGDLITTGEFLLNDNRRWKSCAYEF